ncbi:hypothetical protein C1645_835866 [Glomus cerebriforme]|uniref:Uncharacterized protein n=1 Tax=Glomus cerebriforme TaxID=658196 RepID=A0A397S6X2_9GLOM|nr:hypothetical protein C1645_835866 [Glomus cerebriforme]
MTSRKPARNIKPIIYYNYSFHYVEDNPGEADQFALFKVYNLNRSFGELHKEIISTIGDDDDITVTLIDDSVKSDSTSESSMDGSFIALGASAKIKISFKSQKHRDVIEQLRSSQAIKDLTQNGFADWVPLDSKSYINIERNSKCEKSGSVLNSTKLRSFDDDIDQNLLEITIDDIFQDEIEEALEKLFPGPINTINREVHDVVMKVVVFEILYTFDEEIGRLFVEILNSLIEDRKIVGKSDEIPAFNSLVVRLFTVIRNLMYLNELYGEFKIPSWIPFITQPKLREIRDKIPASHVYEETSLLDIVEFTDLDDPLKKIHTLIRQLQGDVEAVQRKLNDATGRWKTPKQASNILFYGSIASVVIVPTAYYFNNRTANTVLSNRLKISIGCLLSFVLGIWSKKSHHDFNNAISFARRVEPLLNSTKHNVELLEQWLDRITLDGESKISLNEEYKGRRAILKQLFHKFVIVNSLIRNSFNIAA